jgi:hypothetical protein
VLKALEWNARNGLGGVEAWSYQAREPQSAG